MVLTSRYDRVLVQRLEEAVRNRDSDALEDARGDLMSVSMRPGACKTIKALYQEIARQEAYHRSGVIAAGRALDVMKHRLG